MTTTPTTDRPRAVRVSDLLEATPLHTRTLARHAAQHHPSAGIRDLATREASRWTSPLDPTGDRARGLMALYAADAACDAMPELDDDATALAVLRSL